MDTDDLSQEAYMAILIEAEKFNHDLTIQFGLLSSSCVNEKEYIIGAKKLINKIRQSDDADLDDIFFGSPPERMDLFKTLDKILTNIIDVERIPANQRNYDFDDDGPGITNIIG